MSGRLSARERDARARALLERIAVLPGMDREQVLSFRIRAERYVDSLRSLVASHGNAMQRVNEALLRGDRTSAVQIAHFLRGDAAVLGAANLTRAAAELEGRLRAQEPAARVRAEIDAVIAELWTLADAIGLPDPASGA